jgi:hypothetical protein
MRGPRRRRRVVRERAKGDTAVTAVTAMTVRHGRPVRPGGKLLVALAALLLAGTLLGGAALAALAALAGEGPAPAVPITTPAGPAHRDGGPGASTSRGGASGAPTGDLADDPRTPATRGAALA